MSGSDLTNSEILTATSRQRFGAVAKARSAYILAIRLRQSHPGELTERTIADAETALRTSYEAEQRDIQAAARARAQPTQRRNLSTARVVGHKDREHGKEGQEADV